MLRLHTWRACTGGRSVAWAASQLATRLLPGGGSAGRRSSRRAHPCRRAALHPLPQGDHPNWRPDAGPCAGRGIPQGPRGGDLRARWAAQAARGHKITTGRRHWQHRLAFGVAGGGACAGRQGSQQRQPSWPHACAPEPSCLTAAACPALCRVERQDDAGAARHGRGAAAGRLGGADRCGARVRPRLRKGAPAAGRRLRRNAYAARGCRLPGRPAVAVPIPAGACRFRSQHDLATPGCRGPSNFPSSIGLFSNPTPHPTPPRPVLPQHLGVDVDKLLLCQPDSGEMALEVADSLIRSGPAQPQPR